MPLSLQNKHLMYLKYTIFGAKVKNKRSMGHIAHLRNKAMIIVQLALWCRTKNLDNVVEKTTV